MTMKHFVQLYGLAKTLVMGVAALTLLGCSSSPPLRYHALSTKIPASQEASVGSAALLVEILPISIPERLRREEIVFSTANGGLSVLDTDRWAAPLQDEVRQILDDALWRSLKASDVYQSPVAKTTSALPQYRLALRLETFDAIANDHATVESSWTIRQIPQGPIAVCRARFIIPLTGLSVEAAVGALAEGSTKMAQTVSVSLDRLQRGETVPCVQNKSER
jgi:hypothetical protein